MGGRLWLFAIPKNKWKAATGKQGKQASEATRTGRHDDAAKWGNWGGIREVCTVLGDGFAIAKHK